MTKWVSIIGQERTVTDKGAKAKSGATFSNTPETGIAILPRPTDRGVPVKITAPRTVRPASSSRAA